MKQQAIVALLVASAFAPAASAEGEETNPACLRAKSISGWAQGNQQIVRLDTAGRRWRVTFREPCLGTDKSIGMNFGFRQSSYCLLPGDELVFVTIGGHEHFCWIDKIELMKLGEKLVPEPSAEAPPAQQ